MLNAATSTHASTAQASTARTSGGRHLDNRPHLRHNAARRARHGLELRQQLNPELPPRVILSYGLGVDSTAILLRWLLDEDSRDFALHELAVVTAMTGDEWASTGRDVHEHILPLLRRHGVRFIQAARAQLLTTKAGDGIVTRTGTYPLIDWRWNRQDCIDYIASVTGGVLWEKPACVYCPFALANREGRARVLQRFAQDPAAAIEPLMLEHRAVAFNPAQGLIGGRRLIDLLMAEQMHRAVDEFIEAREAEEHVVYEVRRLLRPSQNNPDRLGNAARSLRILDRGNAVQMRRSLHHLAHQRGAELDRSDTITRAWLHRRGVTLPSYEHFLVAAPAGAVEMQDQHFEGLVGPGVEPLDLGTQLTRRTSKAASARTPSATSVNDRSFSGCREEGQSPVGDGGVQGRRLLLAPRGPGALETRRRVVVLTQCD